MKINKIDFNVIKDRIGESVRVAGRGYNAINGVYILCGLQQTLEYNELEHRAVWERKVCVAQRPPVRCRYWVNLKTHTIEFLDNQVHISEAETPQTENKRISDIQAETLKKIKELQ